MASISVTLDSKASTPPEEEVPVTAVPAPEFDNEEDFFAYLQEAPVTAVPAPEFDNEEDFFAYLQDEADAEAEASDGLRFVGTCNTTIFNDVLPEDISFDEFRNTRPIVSAHKKVWRAGHTTDILSLITGTKDEWVSYVTGLAVPTITMLVVFLSWMILLITFKGLGRYRVGFLSGRRVELPPRPKPGQSQDQSQDQLKEETTKAAPGDGNGDGNGGGNEDGGSNEDGNDIKQEMAPSSLPEIKVGKGETSSSALTMPSESTSTSKSPPDQLSSSVYLASSTTTGAELSSSKGAGNDNDNDNDGSSPQLVFGKSADNNDNASANGNAVAVAIAIDDANAIDIDSDDFAIAIDDDDDDDDSDKNKKEETQQESSEREQKDQKPPPLSLSNEEWDELYATKKKQECWMKTVVLFACVMVICMAGVMAQKGLTSLRGSLTDGRVTINYAEELLNGAEVVVDDLANGLGNFRTDVLDLLERSNTGLCPKLKPEGICPQLLEVDSCDFTIQIDFEKNISIDKLDVDTTVDVSYNHSVDVSNVADSIKDKIGLNGTVDLRELLFPDSPDIYKQAIEIFSRNWTIIDTLYDLADKINHMATVASQTEEQVARIEWLFYAAVAFDVIVGLLAACMIVHLLVGEKLPQSLKCIQRRCLFPFFIVCVSLAFIFANAFFIASMALSDTCFNDPTDKIFAIVSYYMGDGLAADYVLGFVEHWLSQCDKEPAFMQDDQAFFEEAQTILKQFDGAIQNVTETATDFCGTTDPTLFADIISTSLKYLCGVIGLTVDVRTAFQCKTWMPLYYNTVYNAMCYNGIDGVWSIAVTQFTSVLMACIILTFRAVFFDLEIIESDNDKVVGAISSSGDHNQNNDENEKKKNLEEGENEVTADQ